MQGIPRSCGWRSRAKLSLKPLKAPPAMPATIHRLHHHAPALPGSGRRGPRRRPVARTTAGRGRAALRRYLYSLSELAPEAPLSFLLVQVLPAGDAPLDHALHAVETMIRPTDRAAHYEEGQIGVVLQGAGAERASAMAALMAQGLLQPGVLPRHASVLISPATGIGRNALALPAAAASTFQECN